MRLLTESGLAERAPEGAWVFYRLAAEGTPSRTMVNELLKGLDPADPVLVQDRERLAAVRASRAEAAQSYFAENAEDWDRLRALHLPEADIESAMRDAAGEGPFGLMIDVGVGSGRVLAVFADRVRRAEGFDTSRQMLSVARAALANLPEGRAAVRPWRHLRAALRAGQRRSGDGASGATLPARSGPRRGAGGGIVEAGRADGDRRLRAARQRIPARAARPSPPRLFG